MTNTEHNLLLALSKWASGQQENFLTEAFAYLIEKLCDSAPDVGAEFLRWLSDGRFCVSQDRMAQISVETQPRLGSDKQPDIRIEGPAHLMYVEMKDRAPVKLAQLTKYADDLRKQRQYTRGRSLILITRGWPGEKAEAVRGISCRRWYAAAEFLRCRRTSIADARASGYVDQFLTLLGGKGMSYEHVGSELAPGVKALQNLMTMVLRALEQRGIRATYHVDKDGYACYFFDRRNHAVTVFLEYAGKLFFETKWSRLRRLSIALGEGWTNMESGYAGKALDLSASGFFDRDASGEQAEMVQGFVEACLREVKYK